MNLIYFWLGLALLLIAAETFVPGAFLLWFGIAAAVMDALQPKWQMRSLMKRQANLLRCSQSGRSLCCIR